MVRQFVAPGDGSAVPRDRVLDELERLQEAVWAGDARIATLRAALAEALPLLAHAEHRPARACRRCRALDRVRAALDAV
jgi:hypothetical protein